MKKILAIALTAALVLSIAGCNNDKKDNADTTTTTAAEATTTEAAEVTTTEAATGADDTTPAADETTAAAADETTGEELTLNPEGLGGDGLEPGEVVPETTTLAE